MLSNFLYLFQVDTTRPSTKRSLGRGKKQKNRSMNTNTQNDAHAKFFINKSKFAFMPLESILPSRKGDCESTREFPSKVHKGDGLVGIADIIVSSGSGLLIHGLDCSTPPNKFSHSEPLSGDSLRSAEWLGDRASVAGASESLEVLDELQYLLFMLSLDGGGLNNAQTSHLHVHVFYHGYVRVDIEFMFG